MSLGWDRGRVVNQDKDRKDLDAQVTCCASGWPCYLFAWRAYYLDIKGVPLRGSL
jgi:hypothetical protein